MSVEKGELPSVAVGAGHSEALADTELPEDWKAALASLASARLEMIRIEAKPASAAAACRIGLLLGGFFGFLCAWVLVLIASVGAIAASTSWEWYHVAYALAGAHFLIGLILMLIMKAGKKVCFPVTRAEFRKDREWLNRLKKQ